MEIQRSKVQWIMFISSQRKIRDWADTLCTLDVTFLMFWENQSNSIGANVTGEDTRSCFPACSITTHFWAQAERLNTKELCTGQLTLQW